MKQLSIGIVGLPNVGKSTLFNAITNAGVEAQNYPFCTIEPNKGIVPIPDERVDGLAKLSQSSTTIYSTIEFVDIAGLVKGASEGQGLGNQFLSHIRETSAIAHMVRCFEDPNIIHVEGNVDPIRDIEIINTELVLADLDLAEKLVSTQSKKTKTNHPEEKAKLALYQRIQDHLSTGKPIRSLTLSDDDKVLLRGIQFITSKKVIYVSNIAESMIGADNPAVTAVQEYAKSQNDEFICLCASIESELSSLNKEEKEEFLKELGLSQSGLGQLAKASFSLLGLQSYLTTGPKETHSWTIQKGFFAPQAAGVIHTDFERGFIRANIVSFEDLVRVGGWKQAREAGCLRQEGKDYIMKDGDVVEFLFNT